MKLTNRPRWKWITAFCLCLGWTTLAFGSGSGPAQDSSIPLCFPWADMVYQDPASGTYPGSPASSSGPTMKYGASPRPDAEAEFLAFTMRNRLLATDADYERIHQDLANIRQLDPDMEQIQYAGNYPDGELIVYLITPDNPLISTEQYDETNRFMGLCEEDRFVNSDGYDVAKLSFPARMNMWVLADRYDPLQMPNLYTDALVSVTSGLDDFIRVFSANQARGALASAADTTFTYEFEDGWLDCIDGCECKEIRTFETEESGDVFYIGTVFYYRPGWEQVCMETRPDNG